MCLGDIYIIEPTGNYNLILTNNLISAGKEVRLVSNNKIVAYRQLCGWDFSDDEHDALALAYYGWLNLDNPGAFNRVRIPELDRAYKLMLSKERVNREIRVLVNRARNLLHTECPELKNIKFTGEDRTTPLWAFLAERLEVKRYQAKVNLSIGTAAKNGFSDELVNRASRIDDLQHERARIRLIVREMVKDARFDWYREVFSEFQFGVWEQALILCQIYPFEQFLDDDLSEKRLILRRKRTRNGHKTTRRIGLKHFHSLLGRGLYPNSSGKFEGYLPLGNQMMKDFLFVWAKRVVIRQTTGKKRTPLKKTTIVAALEEKHFLEASPSYQQLQALMKLDDTTLNQIDKIVGGSPGGALFRDLVEQAIEMKKSPSRILQSRGSKILDEWLTSRICDRAVKLLFKELIVHRQAIAPPES